MSSAPAQSTRVLLIDDDEDDFLITADMLERQPRARFFVEWQSDYEQALAAIREQRHDVYVVDYRLGARTGLELVREAFATRPMAPVIVLTGHAAEDTDVAASDLGVADYLIKQELNPSSLERSIRYAVSHQKAVDVSRSEERYALAIQAANDGIWDWDLVQDRIYFSQRWRAILGQPEQPREDQPDAWLDLVHVDDLAGLRSAIVAHLDGRTTHLQFEHRMRHHDGGWRWVLARGVAIRSADGIATRIAGSLSDVTERRTAQEQLEHDALHDRLTGLPNRALFLDRVSHALERGTRETASRCAVLFFDVDRFKSVNDSLDHSAGDELLVGLASRVLEAVRPGDTVARLGGDEFTVLLENVVDSEAAGFVADRILQSVKQPFSVSGTILRISVSIGIALSDAGSHPAELVRNADIAMYDAKRRGRARSAIFDETMHRRLVNRVARETELRRVLEGSLLEVHYQPIVDLSSGQIAGLEALARWPMDRPSVAPTEFILIAEETGLIGALGHQVMRSALGQLARWRRERLVSEEVCVSVNLSGRQLDEPGLADEVLAAIDAVGLPAHALRLEITESTLMQEINRTQHVFSKVSRSGVGLHLDDFGTGYSSLSTLHQLPVHALKIDRSFVAAISDRNHGSDVIVRSTVALAHALGLPVIAEGIEHAEQLQRLRSLGCEFGQGYLFSPALSPPEMSSLLARWNAHDINSLGAVA